VFHIYIYIFDRIRYNQHAPGVDAPSQYSDRSIQYYCDNLYICRSYKKYVCNKLSHSIVPAVVAVVVVVVVSYCLVDRTCILMMWSGMVPPVIHQYSHVLRLNNAQVKPLHTEVYRRCAANCHTQQQSLLHLLLLFHIIYIVGRNVHNQHVPGGVDSPVIKQY
jgi:hypothetical protein